MSASTCCGGCQNGCGGCHSVSTPSLDAAQQEFLNALAVQKTLPVARFVRMNDQIDDVCIVALEPVYLMSPTDSMEAVKAYGAFLTELEELGLLTLSYETPLPDYSYLEYHTSSLFAFFQETVREGSKNATFLGNTAVLECGSIALTDFGARCVAAC